uniref:Transmembrane protein 182 n=1 Tax=Naja naja TaxID=35670 RepID=A0A8C7E7B8_NAJNA
MKIKIAALLAAILGVLGVFLFLVAFGTDYWLLVTEKCGGFEQVWKEGRMTFHHEGFFWRCWFFGEDYKETIWNFWFSEYERKQQNYHILARYPCFATKLLYRGFWTALIVLAITASLVGVFLLVCGVPLLFSSLSFFFSFFLSFSFCRTGCLFTLLIFMFVVWKEIAADLRKYVLLERSERCPDDTPLTIYYGWSFMFATAGIPLVLLSGLLFYLVGHSILKELE